MVVCSTADSTVHSTADSTVQYTVHSSGPPVAGPQPSWDQWPMSGLASAATRLLHTQLLSGSMKMKVICIGNIYLQVCGLN